MKLKRIGEIGLYVIFAVLLVVILGLVAYLTIPSLIEDRTDGYLDKTGKMVIQPQFAWAGPFSEGLAKVVVGNALIYKQGFIDRTGQFVIKPRYMESLFGFSEGLATAAIPDLEGKFSNKLNFLFTFPLRNFLVYGSEGGGLGGVLDSWAKVWTLTKVGYIDPAFGRTGKMVIPQQFDFAWPFSEGMAAVKVPGKNYGFIDKTGKIVIEPEYIFGGLLFSEGLARISISEKDNKGYTVYKYGYIDQAGNIVIEPKFDIAASKFSEGLARVGFHGEKPGVGTKCGYIDKTGKMVIEPQFNDAKKFSEGLAMVNIGGKWGYIDKTGKIVIQPQFEDVKSFSSESRRCTGNFSMGMACVKLAEKYGFIDKTGNIVIEPKFDLAGDFSEGMAAVKIGDKWGYIDQSGKLVIQTQYIEAGDFSDGLAKVKTKPNWLGSYWQDEQSAWENLATQKKRL